MRILYVCIALDELSPSLANQVNWVRALTTTPGIDHVTVLAAAQVGRRPARRRRGDRDAGGRWSSRRLRKVLRFERAVRSVDLADIDLVWIAMGGGPYPLLLLPAKLRHRLPMVQWKADSVVTARTRLYARWCTDLLLTATPGSLPLDVGTVRAIGHGVDTARFAPPEVPAPRQRDLVVVGRIAPVKRIDAVLRAIAAVRDRTGTAPTLDIVGNADSAQQELRRSLDAQVHDLDLTDAVRFVGPVPYAELPARLATYGAMVQLGEGALDKAVLEAMAVGLPIITSNGRTIEALPDDLAAQVTVPVDGTDAHAERIEATLALDAAGRTALGRRLRQVVVDGHALDTFFTRALTACADEGLLRWPPADIASTAGGAA
ncbi:MAG: glycosyltransferase family 4 protein [Acidimicrobiales bacterium]